MAKIFRREPSELDIVITDVITRMTKMGPDDPDYKKMVKYLNHLTKMRDEQRKASKISPDTKAIIIGNVAIVLAIVAYENANVITTKALDFIVKRR
jgi:hypothetical protein